MNCEYICAYRGCVSRATSFSSKRRQHLTPNCSQREHSRLHVPKTCCDKQRSIAITTVPRGAFVTAFTALTSFTCRLREKGNGSCEQRNVTGGGGGGLRQLRSFCRDQAGNIIGNYAAYNATCHRGLTFNLTRARDRLNFVRRHQSSRNTPLKCQNANKRRVYFTPSG